MKATHVCKSQHFSERDRVSTRPLSVEHQQLPHRSLNPLSLHNLSTIMCNQLNKKSLIRQAILHCTLPNTPRTPWYLKIHQQQPFCYWHTWQHFTLLVLLKLIKVTKDRKLWCSMIAKTVMDNTALWRRSKYLHLYCMMHQCLGIFGLAFYYGEK